MRQIYICRRRCVKGSHTRAPAHTPNRNPCMVKLCANGPPVGPASNQVTSWSRRFGRRVGRPSHMLISARRRAARAMRRRRVELVRRAAGRLQLFRIASPIERARSAAPIQPRFIPWPPMGSRHEPRRRPARPGRRRGSSPPPVSCGETRNQRPHECWPPRTVTLPGGSASL